jgi:hypothetical protein
MTKDLKKTVKEEERYILVHSFTGFNPSSAGFITLSLR